MCVPLPRWDVKAVAFVPFQHFHITCLSAGPRHPISAHNVVNRITKLPGGLGLLVGP